MTAGATFKKLGALLWKNFTLKRRNPIQLVIELLIPVTVVIILILVRTRNFKFRYDACYLHDKFQESASPILFARDFLCFYNSTCSNYPYIDWSSNNSFKLSYAETFKNLSDLRSQLDNIPTDFINLPVWVSQNEDTVSKARYTLANLQQLSEVVNQLTSDFRKFQDGTANDETIKNLTIQICGTERNDMKPFLKSLMNNNNTSRQKRSLSKSQQCYKSAKELINENPSLKYMFKYIGPILWGNIYYVHTESPFIKEVIKRANITYKTLDELRLAAKEWRERYRNELQRDLLDSAQATNIRNLLTRCISLLGSTETGRQCSSINNIYNRQNVINMLDAISQIMKLIEDALDCVNLNKYQPVTGSLNDLNETITGEAFGGLEFNSVSQTKSIYDPPLLFDYNIRMSPDKIDSTRLFKVLDRFWTPSPRRNPVQDLKYYMSGFLNIQQAISDAYISVLKSPNHNIDLDPIMGSSIGAAIQIMPYPCYVSDSFIRFLSSIMPLLILISFISSYCYLVKSIVIERESGTRQHMHVLGITRFENWLSWAISTMVILFCSSFLLAICLKFGNVLEYSNFGLILLLIVSYCWSFICQAFLISTFFSNANIAGVVAGVIYFVLYLPFIVIIQKEDTLTEPFYYLLSLSSQVSLCTAIRFISGFEQNTFGAQFSTMFESTVLNLQFNVGYCIMMLWVDSFIYLILVWYIDAVIPDKYGVPLPWYFPFLKEYWCGGDLSKYTEKHKCCPIVSCCCKKKDNNLGADELNGPFSSDNNNFVVKIEPMPNNMSVGIKINDLNKFYDKIRAVDGLSLDFYEGQITGFLGHNGAGKTTTISILTGMIPATSGHVEINGRPLGCGINKHGKDSIHVGLCPQHNVLFPELTAEDHVMLYSRIRGMTVKEARANVDVILSDVGLLHRNYKTAKSRSLSGGYKRKLSVALAFLGDVKVVFLDEPTAGVDPFARRGIWDMLLKYKRPDRTIILTTHHMDEADFLSDRIAILSRGKLCCAGSSIYLKREFGEGYFLHFERNLKHINMSISLNKKELMEREMNETKQTDDFVKQYVPGARLVEQRRTEWVFVLPCVKDSIQLINLLKALEEDRHNWVKLGFESYGITDTTLEEVFIKVAEQIETKEPIPRQDKYIIGNKSNNAATLPIHDEEPVTDDEYMSGTTSSTSTPRDKCMTPIESPDIPIPIANRRHLSRTLSEMDRIGHNQNHLTSSSFFIAAEDEEKVLVRGHKLVGQQIWGLILKRLYFTKRSIKGFIAELILPICMMLLMIGVVKGASYDIGSQPRMTLSPWLMMPNSDDSTVRLKTFIRSEYPLNSNTDNVPPILLPLSNLTQNVTEKYVQQIPQSGLRCLLPTSPASATPVFLKCSRDVISKAVPFPWQSPDRDVPLESANCSCAKTGMVECPKEAGGPTPINNQIMASTDILMDLSKYNLSDHLVKKFWSYRNHLYGGFQMLLPSQFGMELEAISNSGILPRNFTPPTDNSSSFLQHMGYFVRSSGLKTSYSRTWVNSKGYTSMPAYLNIQDNLLLRYILSTNKTQHSYSSNYFGVMVNSLPFKFGSKELLDEITKRSQVELSVAIFALFALSLIPASFVLFQVEERVTNSKHLQLVSGVSPYIYWFSMFLYDIIKYLVPVLLIIIIFVIFDYQSYIGTKNVSAFCLLLFLYGLAIIPHMYPFSFLFNVPSTAFVVVYSYNVMFGSITTIATFTLDLLQEDDKDLKPINDVLKKVFLLFPQYVLGRGMIELSSNYLKSNASFGLYKYEPFEWQYVGEKITALIILCFGWFGILFLIESGVIDQKLIAHTRNNKLKKREQIEAVNEDEDVLIERELVKMKSEQQFSLKVEDLIKIYNAKLKLCKKKKKKMKTTPGDFDEAGELIVDEDNVRRLIAVNKISFGVMNGECFGLLGVNGAGKTTTFKMLTGAELMTSGYAYICGVSVVEGNKAFRSLGYCPQFDALHSLLTVEEELRLFCLLRGVKIGSETDEVINRSIKQLNLDRHRHKVTSALSGGNKRKLSTALALIGSPKVIFLDEPTAGMDAGARRFLWTRIQELTAAGETRSVILTSHNMEECEVLCHRLAIMVDGQLKCIGSVQHLKTRFGGDYHLKIRLCSENIELSRMKVKKAVDLLKKDIVTKPKIDESIDKIKEESLKDDTTTSTIMSNGHGDNDNKEEHSAIQLREETPYSLMYRLEPSAFGGLALIFEYFDRLKRQGDILVDFSISQTTLDEIFVNFAAREKRITKLLKIDSKSHSKKDEGTTLPQFTQLPEPQILNMPDVPPTYSEIHKNNNNNNLNLDVSFDNKCFDNNNNKII